MESAILKTVFRYYCTLTGQWILIFPQFYLSSGTPDSPGKETLGTVHKIITNANATNLATTRKIESLHKKAMNAQSNFKSQITNQSNHDLIDLRISGILI